MRAWLFFAVVAVWMAPQAVASVEYKCSSGKEDRKIEVAYASTAEKVPCQVRYHKVGTNESEPKVLWSADNDAAYCAEKAEAFIKKLKAWGWKCSEAEEAKDVVGGKDPTGAEKATAGPAGAPLKK